MEKSGEASQSKAQQNPMLKNPFKLVNRSALEENEKSNVTSSLLSSLGSLAW
jgi:hypothetical protein